MTKDRGAYIRKLIDESEYSITELAKLLSVGRNTIYRWINNKSLSMVKMAKIADALEVDISADFPKIDKFQSFIRKDEVKDIDKLTDRNLKNKYVQLLEKHAKVLEELSELKEEIAEYRSKGK